MGGLGWTLKKTLSGDLGLEEGLRYPGRIWVGQVVQVLVTIVGLSYGFKTVNDLSDELQELRQQLSDRVTQEEASRMTNFEFSRLTEDEMVVSLDDAKLLDRLPEKWMVQGKKADCSAKEFSLHRMDWVYSLT